MNDLLESIAREALEDRVKVAMERTDVALTAIRAEIEWAVRKFAPLNSAHEGYAVALEEVDELWAEVKRSKPDHVAMHAEAMQAAAMFVRFMTDVTIPKVENIVGKVATPAESPTNAEIARLVRREGALIQISGSRDGFSAALNTGYPNNPHWLLESSWYPTIQQALTVLLTDPRVQPEADL